MPPVAAAFSVCLLAGDGLDADLSFSSCTLRAISCAILSIHACSKMPPEEFALSQGGEESVETLSKDRERRRGEVDCWTLRSSERDSVGRFECWAFCFEFEDLDGSGDMGAAGRRVEAVGVRSVFSDSRLGSPKSRLPCLPSKRKPGLSGVLGGVASSSSASRSSGMTLDVSDAYVLGSGVFAPVDGPDDSAPSFFRRSTTRFFRFRMPPARDRLAPRLRPADMEFDDAMVGREQCVSLPVLPDATDDVFDLRLPKVDCILERLPCVRPGVAAPESGLSEWPAQARKTASRMPGVKSERVRCDSESAARRRIFFCEKDAWISPGESSDSAEIWDSSSGLPNASTAS